MKQLKELARQRDADFAGESGRDTGTDPNPYGFAGEHFDADTGLIYLRARWYEPGGGESLNMSMGQRWPV